MVAVGGGDGHSGTCKLFESWRAACIHPPAATSVSALSCAWAKAWLACRHFWYKTMADTLAVAHKHVHPNSAHARTRKCAGIRNVRGQVDLPVMAVKAHLAWRLVNLAPDICRPTTKGKRYEIFDSARDK